MKRKMKKTVIGILAAAVVMSIGVVSAFAGGHGRGAAVIRMPITTASVIMRKASASTSMQTAMAYVTTATKKESIRLITADILRMTIMTALAIIMARDRGRAIAEDAVTDNDKK